MEGANLRRSTSSQQRRVQTSQSLQLRGCWFLGHTSVEQLLAQFGIALVGKLQQPLLQALAHLARRLFGKSDSQNLMGRAAL